MAKGTGKGEPACLPACLQGQGILPGKWPWTWPSGSGPEAVSWVRGEPLLLAALLLLPHNPAPAPPLLRSSAVPGTVGLLPAGTFKRSLLQFS